MSPGFLRWKTERALRCAREKHGDDHPATFAAYARAFLAWGSAERLRVTPSYAERVAQTRVWTVVLMRANEDGLSLGWDNRSMRRARARRRPSVDDVMRRAGVRRAA